MSEMLINQCLIHQCNYPCIGCDKKYQDMKNTLCKALDALEKVDPGYCGCGLEESLPITKDHRDNCEHGIIVEAIADLRKVV